MSKCKSYLVYVYTSCLNILYCEQLLIQNDFIVPSHIDHGCKALKHKSNVYLLSTTFLCTCKIKLLLFQAAGGVLIENMLQFREISRAI